MFRIVLLVICGIFMVSTIVTMITDNKASGRASRFMSAFVFGLIFYYIWVT